MKALFGAAVIRLRFLVILGVAAVLAGWPGLALGQSNLRSMLGYRLHNATAGQCVQAINRVQGYVLVNHCNECRSTEIQYQRRDRGFPITRTFHVLARGKVELSFRGSGEVRVTSDTPCDAKPKSAAGTVKGCAKLATRKNGEPALINVCPICRGVVVDRVASSGRHNLEVFTLLPHTLLPLPRRGAAGIHVVKELSCKR